jgi:cation-transporting P-type ATPase E
MVEAARDAADGVSEETSSAAGLTSEEVAKRVAAGRVNQVPRAHSRTVAEIVRANVFTPFNALLGSLLVLIVVVGPIQDALFGVVLVLNVTVGIVQELRAKHTLESLRVLTDPKAKVIRDGRRQEVAVEQVVQDDVLRFGAGDQIVVDGEVLSEDGLEIDESLITGESEPVAKQAADAVLSGSFVVAGSGLVRATDVGSHSYAAKLTADARRFTLAPSELREGINRIIKLVSFLILPTGALLFWSQLSSQHGWHQAVSGAVAGTVAMVPEGLVLLTSIAFAAAVLRLGRRRVLVQELAAVESLARVDVLCMDKTGTLTDGGMAVDTLVAIAPDPDTEEALAAMAAADPSPNATMRAIAGRFKRAPEEWKPAGSVAFSSARKWSAVAFDGHGAWYLGAPDMMVRSKLEAVDRYTSAGRRTLLLARAKELTGDQLPTDLKAVAAIVMAESLRANASETLRYFVDQGVAVKLISGDDPRTVGAIAQTMGIEGAGDPFDARDLPTEAGAIGEAMKAHTVFGRVMPAQKVAMVRALRSLGHTVAMTGDGVNDALALKEADIGVAMGSGSEATRAVAQIVLLDSDLAALPPVVAEGRRVLGNIERTSGLYLTKTSYAMLLALATGVSRFAFPFLPRHLSLVAALTIGIPSFFLALAPGAERFRPGFVRRVMRFAVPAGALAGVATLLAYALARRSPGIDLGQARTTAVITLTFVGFLVLSIVATPFTGWRRLLLVSLAGAFVATMLLSGTRHFFALRPPPLIVWLAALGIASIVWSFARLLVPGEEPVGPTGRG